MRVSLQVSLRDLESDTNASQHFVGVRIATLMWINDGVGIRQLFAWQVVI